VPPGASIYQEFPVPRRARHQSPQFTHRRQSQRPALPLDSRFELCLEVIGYCI
jgi:hypothetical protein